MPRVSSAEVRVPRWEPEGVFRLDQGLALGFVLTRSVAFDLGLQKLPRRGGVADGGLLVDAEHDG